MSASQEKKIRKEQRAQGTEKRQVKKQKATKAHKKQTWIGTVVTIVLVLAVAYIILINTNLFYQNFTAVKIGDESYSAAEFNYYYHNSYYTMLNQYGSYISQIGLDTTKPLESQTSMSGGTWADYFKEQATNSMQQVTMLWSEAVKEGFELSDEDRAQMETTLDGLNTTYKDAGYSSANAFLEANYGKGVTEDIVKKLIERGYIANAYSTAKKAGFEYTDDDLASYYTENENNLDKFSYIAYFVDGSAPAEATDETGAASGTDVSADGGNSAVAAGEAMAAAKAKADGIVNDSSDLESFQAAVTADGGTGTVSTMDGSSITGVYGDWVKDAARVSGDKTVIEDESGYYAVFFDSRDRNDYVTKNCRHILIKAVADDTGAVTDDAKAAAKKKCEELLATWQSGDATEDSFAALANENSEDTGSNTKGGLYENVAKGQFVSEFDAWLYDSARQPGDTGIVYNDSANGYHLVYFVGNGENYRDYLADSGKRSADYSAWETTALESYPISKGLTYGLAKQVGVVSSNSGSTGTAGTTGTTAQ